MADERAEANRMTALREAAINATLDHPHIVTTYTYDMQPLGDTQTSERGFLDWQMYIIQVCRLALIICPLPTPESQGADLRISLAKALPMFSLIAVSFSAFSIFLYHTIFLYRSGVL